MATNRLKPSKELGRPSSFIPGKIIENGYDPTHPEILFKLMSEGKLDVEIMAEMGLKKDTFYRWIREHEDFKNARDLGMAPCEAWWTRRIRDCWERGDDKGFKYCIAIMNNKFGWGKDENKTVNNTINISGNMNVLQNKSLDELKELIEQDVAYLKLNNVIDVIDVTPESDEPKS